MSLFISVAVVCTEQNSIIMKIRFKKNTFQIEISYAFTLHLNFTQLAYGPSHREGSKILATGSVKGATLHRLGKVKHHLTTPIRDVQL